MGSIYLDYPVENNMVYLRYLNKCLIKKPFTIPEMAKVFQKIEGWEWVISLDLNMGYHAVHLDPDSQKICATIKLWDKYQY